MPTEEIDLSTVCMPRKRETDPVAYLGEDVGLVGHQYCGRLIRNQCHRRIKIVYSLHEAPVETFSGTKRHLVAKSCQPKRMAVLFQANCLVYVGRDADIAECGGCYVVGR